MPGGQYIALSGMRLRLDELDRLSIDLANAGTAGYKAEEIVQKREEVREKTIKSVRAAVGELMEIGVQGPVSQEQREALERIQRSQRHLLGLINQVLNYARLETGTVRYTFADVPLDGMLPKALLSDLNRVAAKGRQGDPLGAIADFTEAINRDARLASKALSRNAPATPTAA